jgi:hypothetical protein
MHCVMAHQTPISNYVSEACHNGKPVRTHNDVLCCNDRYHACSTTWRKTTDPSRAAPSTMDAHCHVTTHRTRVQFLSKPRHESKSSRRRATQRLVTAPSVEDACFPTSHVHTSSSKLPHGSALMYSNNTMLRTGLGFSTPCRASLLPSFASALSHVNWGLAPSLARR